MSSNQGPGRRTPVGGAEPAFRTPHAAICRRRQNHSPPAAAAAPVPVGALSLAPAEGPLPWEPPPLLAEALQRSRPDTSPEVVGPGSAFPGPQSARPRPDLCRCPQEPAPGTFVLLFSFFLGHVVRFWSASCHPSMRCGVAHPEGKRCDGACPGSEGA